jgi:hypothetical protein
LKDNDFVPRLVVLRNIFLLCPLYLTVIFVVFVLILSLDTIKSLGIPSQDTIAVLQQPVEELDKTSQCTIELHPSDDKTLDLWFILDICSIATGRHGTTRLPTIAISLHGQSSTFATIS